MKKIVFAIIALFGATIVSAQTGNERLVNRIDVQEGTVINISDHQAAESSPTFSIWFDATRLPLEKTYSTVEGHIVNNTQDTLKFGFYRTHIHLPTDWSSSICMGVCFPTSQDSMPSNFEFYVAPGDLKSLMEYNILRPTVTSSDSIVDYIKYVALNGNPADTFGITFVGTFQTAGVEHQTSAATQSKILSLYPSPLIEGNSIRVKVSSPKEQSFTYSISDELGRSVAFGTTHQRLSQGDNTCQIGELSGLATGTYLLKFTFADGSVDTRTFQVAH